MFTSMRLRRNSAFLLICGVMVCGMAAAKSKKQNADAAIDPAKPAKHSKVPLIGVDDGLAVISAALDAHTRHAIKLDCSHLVHQIYDRAGFPYAYASSSDLYAGVDEFRRVPHPQPGDLVVWPGHVGIVVNPAQHSFYSALSTGLGVDAYDSDYWKDRGQPRFLRFVKRTRALDRARSDDPAN